MRLESASPVSSPPLRNAAWIGGIEMYKELVKRLREFASIPEHCENVDNCDECSKEDICLSFTNKQIIEVSTQAADVIEQLEKKVTEWQEEACKWNNEYFSLRDSMAREDEE